MKRELGRGLKMVHSVTDEGDRERDGYRRIQAQTPAPRTRGPHPPAQAFAAPPVMVWDDYPKTAQ